MDEVLKYKPYGIDISGGVEKSRGIKSNKKIIEFLKSKNSNLITVKQTDSLNIQKLFNIKRLSQNNKILKIRKYYVLAICIYDK